MNRWKNDPPTAEQYLSLIRNQNREMDPRWCATIAWMLSNQTSAWPLEKNLEYLQVVFKQAAEEKRPAAKQLYLMSSSWIFQKAEAIIAIKKEAKESFNNGLVLSIDKAAADIIQYMLETIQTTNTESNEEKGLFNSYLSGLLEYYLLFVPSVESKKNVNPAEYPASCKQVDRIAPIFKSILEKKESIYKINHTFQMLVLRMDLSKDISSDYLTSLKEDARFQDQESQDAIQFMNSVYQARNK
ncbi:MAG: hypothetical protein AB1656_02475 [Candidatus Omnitrophota bacterium]